MNKIVNKLSVNSYHFRRINLAIGQREKNGVGSPNTEKEGRKLIFVSKLTIAHLFVAMTIEQITRPYKFLS